MLKALLQFDQSLFLLLNGRQWPAWLDAFFVFITEDDSLPVRALMIGLWIFLMLRSPIWRRRALWVLLLIAVADTLSSQVLKELFQRVRPCRASLDGLRLLVDCGPAYSFPSSHAVNMGAVGAFLASGVKAPRHRALILLLPLLVAYSRVHVGVHYPLDVICGFAIGLLLALVFERLLRHLPTGRGGLGEGST